MRLNWNIYSNREEKVVSLFTMNGLRQYLLPKRGGTISVQERDT
ncbi:rCG26220 [Rattus norvegicus]|uniref:RCG26220 n=1 Tax=Rattus norvegicus TaxID=10116 RepID=A6HP17_RAT|nr:rCG26220 [Rattus norvegicus]